MSVVAFALIVLIAGLIFAAEIWIVVRIARRLVPLARQLGDPAQRAALLSEDTRQALRDAGYDVATLDHASLARTPELKARVDAELRGALKTAWRDALKTAWRDALPGKGRGAARTPTAAAAPAPGPAPTFSGRPAPIDDPSADRVRGALALAVVAAAAIGTAFWLLA